MPVPTGQNFVFLFKNTSSLEGLKNSCKDIVQWDDTDCPLQKRVRFRDRRSILATKTRYASYCNHIEVDRTDRRLKHGYFKQLKKNIRDLKGRSQPSHSTAVSESDDGHTLICKDEEDFEPEVHKKIKEEVSS